MRKLDIFISGRLIHSPPVRLLLLCLGILWVSFSSQAQSADQNAEESGAESESIVLQLKWFHQFQFAGYYAALEQGFYAEEGLDVELRERDPLVTPVEAVVSGEAQFGIGDSSLVLSRLSGQPVVVMAAIFQRSPLVFLTLQESGISIPLELEGKRLMFQRNIDDAGLSAMLAEWAVTADDYEFVPHNFDDKALLSGQVDAMSAYVTTAPFIYQQQDKPVNMISPSSYGIDLYGDMLFVNENFLQEHPEKALAFRRASIRGWQYALQYPEQIITLISEDYGSEQSLEHLIYEARETRRMILPDYLDIGHINPERFHRIVEVYKQLGMVPHGAELEGLDYRQYLDSEESDFARWFGLLVGGMLALGAIMMVLYGVNLRLQKAVAARTRELARTTRELGSKMDLLDKYVVSCTTDLQGRITQVTAAFCQLSGYSRSELIGQKFSRLHHPDMNPEVYNELWQSIRSNQVWEGEILNRTKAGEAYWIHNHIEPVFDEQGGKVGYTSMAVDITGSKRAEYLSNSDALTGLRNRRYLDELCELSIAQAQRYGRPLSIVLFDIDYFKRINDEYGHQAGDRLLQRVASLALENVRESDVLGRWGGEEFMVICTDTDSRGASILAEQLHQTIGEHQFPYAASISCSFGVAEWCPGESAAGVFRRCDQALYKAKAIGRNRIQMADKPQAAAGQGNPSN